MQANFNRDHRTWTATDFLNARLPSKLEGARSGRIHEEAAATATKPIVTEDTVQSIEVIPPIHLIRHAMQLFEDDKKKDWFAQITRFGYVTKGALVPLVALHDAVDFAVDLRGFLDWLNLDSDDSDGLFTRSLRQRILDQEGIMDYKFVSSYGIETSVKSVMSFRGEAWIDVNGIGKVMETLKKKFGHRGTYLFVPTQIFTEWTRYCKNPDGSPTPWNMYQSTVLAMENEAEKARSANEKKDIRAFSIVDLEGHWGAFSVDFAAKKILFGHSLDGGRFPESSGALHVLKRWLLSCGIVFRHWTHDRLDVPQNAGTGSCGINALNAIEREFDPMVERWKGEKDRYHRIRLLRLLTESAEVRST